MYYHLTVTEPFGDYKRGDHITDPSVIAKVKESHPQHVVQRFPHPEHLSGDFYRSDREIADRNAEVNK